MKTRSTTSDFIAKSKVIHGDKYNYSEVKYIKALSKVKIYCNTHKEYFYQIPNSHLSGTGCFRCNGGGYSQDKAGTLYYLKVQYCGNVSPLYKVGITNKTVQERFSNNDLDMITIIDTITHDDGKYIYQLERETLRKFKAFKYQGDNILDSGNTELFTKDVLGGSLINIKEKLK